MQCLTPIVINIKGTKKYVEVPCGKCETCLVNRQYSWAVRLRKEMEHSEQAIFFTLTQEDSFIKLYCNDLTGECIPTLCKSDLSGFLKRLRNYYPPKSIKFYAIGEYGPQTYRPHYHGILFFKDRLHSKKSIHDNIEKAWPYGFITMDTVNENRIKYVSGYFLSKLDCPDHVIPPFALMSKGLGKDYIDEFAEWHTSGSDRFYVPYFNKRQPLPRYYKDRIYSKADREDFADKMFYRAMRKRQEDLDLVNGSEEELQNMYREQRIATARRIRKEHKKKML